MRVRSLVLLSLLLVLGAAGRCCRGRCHWTTATLNVKPNTPPSVQINIGKPKKTTPTPASNIFTDLSTSATSPTTSTGEESSQVGSTAALLPPTRTTSGATRTISGVIPTLSSTGTTTSPMLVTKQMTPTPASSIFTRLSATTSSSTMTTGEENFQVGSTAKLLAPTTRTTPASIPTDSSTGTTTSPMLVTKQMTPKPASNIFTRRSATTPYSTMTTGEENFQVGNTAKFLAPTTRTTSASIPTESSTGTTTSPMLVTERMTFSIERTVPTTLSTTVETKTASVPNPKENPPVKDGMINFLVVLIVVILISLMLYPLNQIFKKYGYPEEIQMQQLYYHV